MGGRGSSNPSGGGGSVSAERAERIRNGVATHTKEENDRAERNYRNSIAKEKDIIDKKDAYIKTGFIKSANDPWFKEHVDTYNSLVAQLKLFERERKRQKR